MVTSVSSCDNKVKNIKVLTAGTSNNDLHRRVTKALVEITIQIFNQTWCMIYAATLILESSTQGQLWFTVYLHFRTFHFYLIHYFEFLPLPSAYTMLSRISLPSMTDIPDGQPLEGQLGSLLAAGEITRGQRKERTSEAGKQ